ncbi:MAG TPA: hypothetical protein VJJ98_03795 [Sedimentisphaerales bacterium]|nr:hypothetical protein [Sedimentisphaerales bacterium]
MDYYNELKPQAEQTAKVFAQQFAETQKQIQQIKKRLVDEQDSAERVQTQIDKLKELSGASLIEGQNSYEKFKTSLRTRNTERDTAFEIIQTLRDEILPQKQEVLENEQRKLERALTDFCESKRPVCEQKMTELLDQVVAEKDAFLLAVEQLFSDYGLLFKPGKSANIIPRPVHPRIDPQRPGCVIVPVSLQERAKQLQRKSQEKA